jgi:hypothetical protein
MKKRIGSSDGVFGRTVVLLKMAGAVYKIPPGLLLGSCPALKCMFLWKLSFWISSEISLASASTVRAHFGCIFKATTDCTT